MVRQEPLVSTLTLWAQSFIVDDPTGVYLTGIDLYFQEKPLDFDVPVTVQIREVELGTPSQRILPFSEVNMDPDDITTSNDASVSTRFTFESPVYLNGQREYAIIILSNSTEYRVWTSRLGEVDISSVGGDELIRFSSQHRDFWVHCSNLRTLLLGHHLSMKTLRLNCIELILYLKVQFNSLTHHLQLIWKLFQIMEFNHLTKQSELDLELQQLRVVLNQV